MNNKKTILIFCIAIFLLSERKANAQIIVPFNYVSDTTQTWTIPPCVSRVTVQLWAGGGGGGFKPNIEILHNAGGSGSYYEGVISGLIPGTILDLYVPSGGQFLKPYAGPRAIGGWPGGGYGGAGGGTSEPGGGGGGYAAIQINGTYYVVAGAGGGAGATEYGLPPDDTAYGGSGGATTGGNGAYPDPPLPPGGGGGAFQGEE